jgi:hypothetical protein
MSFGSKSAAVAAALAVGALMAPAAASAQSYGYAQNYGSGAYGQSYDYNNRSYGSGYGQSYYDPCTRERQGRTGAGATIGATLGAVAGSQLAARGRRTEGSVLGGVLGAVVGANVGRSSSQACYSRQGYGQGGYDDRSSGYAYSQNDAYYGRDDYDRRYDDSYSRQGEYDDYGYGSTQGYAVQDRHYQGSDQCRLAESRIRLPDGRSEVRYVRTCPDQYGRYRVVD